MPRSEMGLFIHSHTFLFTLLWWGRDLCSSEVENHQWKTLPWHLDVTYRPLPDLHRRAPETHASQCGYACFTKAFMGTIWGFQAVVKSKGGLFSIQCVIKSLKRRKKSESIAARWRDCFVCIKCGTINALSAFRSARQSLAKTQLIL